MTRAPRRAAAKPATRIAAPAAKPAAGRTRRAPGRAGARTKGGPLARLRRVLLLLGLLALFVLPWAGGFMWFLHRATTAIPLPTHADGIVALTGGADRIETALRLLAAGRADRLLISGVGGMADFSELARRAGLDRTIGARVTDRVTLGRDAVSTHGNAAETAIWTRANGVRSLLVVTAFYHMPRALAELARAMPDVRLYPVAVLPPDVPLRLLAAEYVKYLAAASGLTGISQRTDTLAGGSTAPPDSGG